MLGRSFFEGVPPRLDTRCPRRPLKLPLRRCASLNAAQASLHSEEKSFDVYAISDLHADNGENLEWLKALPTKQFAEDILIVAGDVSEDLYTLRKGLSMLTDRFKRVAFVPGNHELWATGHFRKGCRKGDDSMGKLQRVMEMCERLNVITRPTKIDRLWIVPLLSWHHQSFDAEPDLPSLKENYAQGVSDYKFCRWTSLPPEDQEHGSASLAETFDRLNQDFDPSDDCDVISFSHFVPRYDLIPEKHHLKYSFLAKVAGSTYLNRRVQKLRPHIHVFGHTHIAWDATLDGVRYVQCPLGTPKERRGRPSSLLLSTSEYNPRIYERHWPLIWQKNVQWLPAKIYTHDPSPSLDTLVPKRPETTNDAFTTLTSTLTRPKRENTDSRPLNAGIMHPCYARWSQYYSVRKR